MNKLYTFIKIFISLFFIFLLFRIIRPNLENLFQIYRNANFIYVFLGVIISILAVFLLSIRLKLIFYVQNIHFLLRDIISLTFIGFFFNNFLPATAGGDIAKAYYTFKTSKQKSISVISILADRLFGILTLLTITLIALFFIEHIKFHAQLIGILLVLILGSILIIVFVSNKRLINKLSPILSRLGILKYILKIHKFSLAYKKIKLLSIIVVSLSAQVFWFLSVYFLAKSLNLDIPITIIFLILPVIFTVSKLPSLNGLGIRESAFIYFLKDYIGSNNAFALSLLYLGIYIIISLSGGILFLARGAKKDKITYS